MPTKKTKVTRVSTATVKPTARNNDLSAWLGGTGNPHDICSITWVKETKQWVVVFREDAN